jgi:hypothetical protein
MTPPPCNCAHVETIVVWTRGAKEPEKQRHDRCIHPSGPHPMNEFCRVNRLSRRTLILWMMNLISAQKKLCTTLMRFCAR